MGSINIKEPEPEPDEHPIVPLVPVPPHAFTPQSHALLAALRNGDVAQNLTYTTLSCMTDGFHPSERLGSGAFGDVYEGDVSVGLASELETLQRTNPQDYAELSTLKVAVKLSHRVQYSQAAVAMGVNLNALNEDQRQMRAVWDAMRREIKTLRNLRHPNIVRLLAFYVPASWREGRVPVANKESEQRLCLVYEYASAGDLRAALIKDAVAQQLTWQIRLRIASSIAKAIKYLHTIADVPIFHRDIKSANIVLTGDFTAKLIDCGLAKFIANDAANGITSVIQTAGDGVGTRGYMCPTYARGRPYDEKAEVYSFGMVLLELLVGHPQLHGDRDLFGDFIEDGACMADAADARAGNWPQNCKVQWEALARDALAPSKRDRIPDMRTVVLRLKEIEREFLRTNGGEASVHAPDVMCGVCRDMFAHDECVSCVSNIEPPDPHHYCKDCFRMYISHACNGENRGTLLANRGNIMCDICGEPPQRNPFPVETIIEALGDQERNAYIAARGQVMHQLGINEAEERLRNASSSVDGQVNFCCEYFERNVVLRDSPNIIKCPNAGCGAALLIPDNFNACFALKCDSCRNQFCGWCLCHVGADAHDHVRYCNLNGNEPRPDGTKSVYVPPHERAVDVLRRSIRTWRQERINQYMEEQVWLSEAAKVRVGEMYAAII